MKCLSIYVVLRYTLKAGARTDGAQTDNEPRLVHIVPAGRSRKSYVVQQLDNTLGTDGVNPRHPVDDAAGAPTQGAKFRIGLVSLLGVFIGLTAGVIAFLLYRLIGLVTNIFFFHRWSFAFTSARNNHLGLLVIVTPVIGGIIVGIMARYGSDKIRGHGIPEAMEAVLVNRSRIEPKVAILKPLSAAIAIGTGGPFGAEGPIIQTGGAIGSLVGQLMHTTAAERKVLLACGAAAGMAATFNTPIAGVILAIELLLFEFKSRSFIPLVIASTLATAVHFQLLGRGPMFSAGAVDFGVPHALPFYLLLGVLCGAAALGFSRALYWVEDQFEKLPIHQMWWPAIGALGLGIIGYFVPRVLGVGYDTISDILNTKMVLGALLAVMVFKSAALVISLGSGTSGGLLAPMFMASAAMGSAYAMIIDKLWPGAGLSPGAFALVAMGAVFGAASRAAFTFIIFAFEITRDYNSVLPLMLVTVIADAIAVRYAKNSIMTEKLARRGLRIQQDYAPDVLQQVLVRDSMSQQYDTVPATMLVTDLVERVGKHDPSVTKHQAVFIVDQNAALVGVVTRGDLMRSLEQARSTPMTVFEAGTHPVVVAFPDEVLYDATARMLRANVGRMPVVKREAPTQIVGYLGRTEIMGARLRQLDEESVREHGWVGAFRRPR